MASKRSVTACAALLVTALVLQRSVGRADYSGPLQAFRLDLERPDALVRSRSLAQLPRDLLRVPMARDVLREDLVFYYEGHPDRLGLRGSLRRIAYEHQLDWQDDLLSWALDRPAEIALWRGSDGRLRHWLAALDRPRVGGLLQQLAQVAASDSQLSRVGSLAVDGEAADVYVLEYGPGKRLALAGHGERAVLLSDPGLLFDAPERARPSAAALIGDLLSADLRRQGALRESFALSGPAPEHSVSLGAHFLSFGYQRFFPGLEALRFDFGPDGWSTQALLAPDLLPSGGLQDGPLWSALPAGAAACALLPIDWRASRKVLEGVETADGRRPADLASRLVGPAAVCWYDDGRLLTPLFAATLESAEAPVEPLLDALFDWGIASRGPGGRRPGPGAALWQRTLLVPFAAVSAAGAPRPGPLTVSLARRGRTVFFSPASEQVERALATQEKRYPALAETLPADGVTLAVLSPPALARLLRGEALVMLPRDAEPYLRDAADRLLLPRLDALARQPRCRLTLAVAPTERGWQRVQWQELSQ
jgi:uncharacterized protein YfaA (DUF2138 family)